MDDTDYMAGKRGALIVLEGCDRAGKSTQAKLLTNALNDLKIPTKALRFPNRETLIGGIIDKFLSKEINLPPEAAHLLFSANRWEFNADIEKTLLSGITMVIDRYAASGAVYTEVNSNKCLSWCRQPDIGLVKPDCVLLLNVSKQQQEQRSNWGEERFDRYEFQKRVYANYEKLRDDTWITINANLDESTVHAEILQKILPVIQKVQYVNMQFIRK